MVLQLHSYLLGSHSYSTKQELHQSKYGLDSLQRLHTGSDDLSSPLKVGLAEDSSKTVFFKRKTAETILQAVIRFLLNVVCNFTFWAWKYAHVKDLQETEIPVIQTRMVDPIINISTPTSNMQLLILEELKIEGDDAHNKH